VSLTPKREKFAQAVASGMDQSDAYRSAFDAQAMKPNSVHREASLLMSNPMVTQRVSELRAPAVKKVGITLESHLADLEELRNMAKDMGQIQAAITAEVARGKHSGVAAPDKRELGGPNGTPIPVAAVSPDEYRRIALEIAAKT
jgi:phage terminase small subunit